MGKFSGALEEDGYSFEPKTNCIQPALSAGEDNSFKPKGTGQPVAEDGLPAQHGLGKWDQRLVQAVNFSGEVAESFRVLRSKILMPQDGKKVPKTIMVTSVLPKEGKSFVTANLGVALAQCVDQYSLMVDCDLRLPSLSRLFGISNELGLTDYLRNKTDISTLILKTSMEKLTILASGVPPANPAELLGSALMHALIEELSKRYPDRFVIFDTPPLLVASESMTLAQVVDGVVLVVRQGVSSKALIEQAVADIGKQKIIGVIFNSYKSNIVASKLMSKSYSYYGDYHSEKNKKIRQPMAD
jgi:protein-tyrosine kinase